MLATTLMLSAQTVPGTNGLRFVPTMSCRLADVQITQGQTRVIPVRQGGCLITPGARAYALRITVSPDTAALGYLTVFPTGRPRPLASTLNSWDGRIVTNAAIIEAGEGDNISVYASDSTFVTIELNGHFLPREHPASGLSFYRLDPCRLVDTRGNPRIAMVGPMEHTIAARDRCGLPPEAVAYSLNLTVVPENPALLETTIYPAGHVRPNTPSLITIERQVVSSAAIVEAGQDGKINVYGTQGHDVVLDINGYFAPAGHFGALMYRPVNPCRIADTRSGASLGTGDTRVFPVRGLCNVPQDADVFAFNTTAVPPGPLGFVTFWPAYFPQPFVSTLNAPTGQVTANMALVPVGLSGSIAAYSSNPTHLVLDINGYFVRDRPPTITQ
ncbi:MAG: hypothetical protein JNK87_08050 [Bryobacterales bacterium]|nr:hypothetical protein [Bryobacterales bacterium]